MEAVELCSLARFSLRVELFDNHYFRQAFADLHLVANCKGKRFDIFCLPSFSKRTGAVLLSANGSSMSFEQERSRLARGHVGAFWQFCEHLRRRALGGLVLQGRLVTLLV